MCRWCHNYVGVRELHVSNDKPQGTDTQTQKLFPFCNIFIFPVSIYIFYLIFQIELPFLCIVIFVLQRTVKIRPKGQGQSSGEDMQQRASDCIRTQATAGRDSALCGISLDMMFVS